MSFEPGVSVLVGANGQGKTNLIEAIGYLATLSSHRVATEQALIKAGESQAVIAARLVEKGRAALVEVAINAGRANAAKINRSPVRRTRDILGITRAVTFAPEDVAIVKGDPDGRRRFLDELLVQLSPRLAGVKQDYDKVLKQRSALLKTAGAARRGGTSSDHLRTLDVWDTHLAEAGAQILAARLDLLRRIQPVAADRYRQLAGDHTLEATYSSSIETLNEASDTAVLTAQLADALAHARPRELERGVCLVGPHRDDIALTLNSLPARGYASHGESWSIALALRLAAFDVLTADEFAPSQPILILDDVFAELDAARRSCLADIAARAEQVLITAAVVEDIPFELDGARYDVERGEVTRVR